MHTRHLYGGYGQPRQTEKSPYMPPIRGFEEHLWDPVMELAPLRGMLTWWTVLVIWLEWEISSLRREASEETSSDIMNYEVF